MESLASFQSLRSSPIQIITEESMRNSSRHIVEARQEEETENGLTKKKRGMGRVVSAPEEKEFCYTGCLKGIDGTAVKKESQLMKDQSEENKKIVEGQEAAKFTPFPVMNVSNLGGDVEHIKYLLTSSSGFMLRGLETACGINRTLGTEQLNFN